MPTAELLFRQHFENARQATRTGHFAFAEKNCLCALDLSPGSPDALNLLGIVAARVGAKRHAMSLLRAAIAARAGDPVLADNLEQIRALPDPLSDAPARTRYLVIKAWGYGFWSDVTHVLGCLLLAEITGRIPVIHWGSNSLYGGSASTDAFTFYFEPINGYTLNDLAVLTDGSCFPAKWSQAGLSREDLQKWEGQGARTTALQFLERPEPIAVCDFYIGVIDVAPWLPADHPVHGRRIEEIYRYLIERYLKVRPELRARCEEFKATFLSGGSYIAVHLRGSDKVTEHRDLAASNNECMKILAAQDPAGSIFLLTDDERLLADCRRLYGSRVVVTRSQRTSSQIGTHHLPDVDRRSLGEEIVVDTYLAADADTFIGNGRSNVAAMVALLKAWSTDRCKLVRPSQLLERKLSLHRPNR